MGRCCFSPLGNNRLLFGRYSVSLNPHGASYSGYYSSCRPDSVSFLWSVDYRGSCPDQSDSELVNAQLRRFPWLLLQMDGNLTEGSFLSVLFYGLAGVVLTSGMGDVCYAVES